MNFKERTARKPHSCCKCYLPIEKGKKYIVCVDEYGRTAKTFYFHTDCVSENFIKEFFKS